jgi:hypothetical protein
VERVKKYGLVQGQCGSARKYGLKDGKGRGGVRFGYGSGRHFRSAELSEMSLSPFYFRRFLDLDSFLAIGALDRSSHSFYTSWTLKSTCHS